MANCSRLIKLVASTGNRGRGRQSALITSPACCGGQFDQGPWLGWVAGCLAGNPTAGILPAPGAAGSYSNGNLGLDAGGDGGGGGGGAAASL